MEYKKKLYEWKINQAKPVNRFKYNIAKFYTNSDIIVIIFDFADENSFNENLIMIEDIKKDLHDEQQLIYLLGVNLDKANKEELEIIRQKSKVLLDTRKIDKYFEISGKNRECLDNFIKILKMDSINSAYIIEDKNEIKESLKILKSKKKNKCNIF